LIIPDMKDFVSYVAASTNGKYLVVRAVNKHDTEVSIIIDAKKAKPNGGGFFTAFPVPSLPDTFLVQRDDHAPPSLYTPDSGNDPVPVHVEDWRDGRVVGVGSDGRFFVVSDPGETDSFQGITITPYHPKTTTTSNTTPPALRGAILNVAAKKPETSKALSQPATMDPSTPPLPQPAPRTDPSGKFRVPSPRGTASSPVVVLDDSEVRTASSPTPAAKNKKKRSREEVSKQETTSSDVSDLWAEPKGAVRTVVVQVREVPPLPLPPPHMRRPAQDDGDTAVTTAAEIEENERIHRERVIQSSRDSGREDRRQERPQEASRGAHSHGDDNKQRDGRLYRPEDEARAIQRVLDDHPSDLYDRKRLYLNNFPGNVPITDAKQLFETVANVQYQSFEVRTITSVRCLAERSPRLICHTPSTVHQQRKRVLRQTL
jgi:hypothetical protein